MRDEEDEYGRRYFETLSDAVAPFGVGSSAEIAHATVWASREDPGTRVDMGLLKLAALYGRREVARRLRAIGDLDDLAVLFDLSRVHVDEYPALGLSVASLREDPALLIACWNAHASRFRGEALPDEDGDA